MLLEQLFKPFDKKQTQYEITVPKNWSQGRTIYGGLSAALAYQAAENLIDDERLVRSFHCNFIGPLIPEQPIHISAEILRSGKNVTQIVAKVSQNGQVGVMSQVCFGIDRDSEILQVATDRHDMPAPKKPKYIPLIPKVVPKFVQHFNYSFNKGDLSVTKSQKPILHGWTRFNTAPAQMNMAHLIAIMDALPPTMLQMVRLPVPASTMSWNIEFINPELIFQGNQWVASQTEAYHIRNGYGHEQAKFWHENGQLLAISKQVVAVFG
ncbi:thioesterase family protein [Thalassotalea sp. 1_MG-2023]|uniref:acyl-CoA thioesterase n=1 Tax=Thalassotalea sp. 1_MG-2023 TaxID=3062680 RepID=UPI0026E2F361|nr:thioesterase family protein [Thalassotalea sp. 1_MG-2023]MDO6427907.1 thioesterase family protein [Thalassotalea sp. 1_MG-2023]